MVYLLHVSDFSYPLSPALTTYLNSMVPTAVDGNMGVKRK